MKRNPAISLLVSSLILILSSCQENELQYSCDPSIDEFVRENLTSLSQLSVTELVSYNIDMQRAIFISWDYKKKREAWIDKLQYIMNNQPFADVEKQHIQKLIDHITEDYFMDEKIIKSEAVNRSLFAKEWINYAKKELSLSEKYIAFIRETQISGVSELKFVSRTIPMKTEGLVLLSYAAKYV